MVLLLLVLAMFLTGCQKSPDNNIVIPNNQLKNNLSESQISLFDQLILDDRWEETLFLSGSKKPLIFNAKISVPDINKAPVYKIEERFFNEDIIMPFIKQLLGESPIYKRSNPTKKECEEAMLLAMQNNDYESEKMFASMIETAPEEKNTEVVDFSALPNAINGTFEKNGRNGYISVEKDFFDYSEGLIITQHVLEINDMGTIPKLSMTEKIAQNEIDSLMSILNLEYMSIHSIEKAKCLDYTDNLYYQYNEDSYQFGYYVTLVRNIDGIPGIKDGTVIYNVDDQFAYTAPLYPEEARLFISENGEIRSFCYTNPKILTEKLYDNVELMSFEKIKDISKNMLNYINAYDAEEIIVTDISLKMAIVNMNDELLYVPSWFFVYTRQYEDYEQEYTLVLNAIDGGRVLELPVPEYSEMEFTLS